ncbi:hypothetical protein [Pseudomonas schmalbachii]|uniref:Uncharacterized protein n=1 Tax=Pseudomonas schmalbachii TaxID=2816993 RepID=A0ABS3TJR9_9PSED|nr:hypothetical protein [Pseudomonas schmalbachii]MBO3273905.1 hypothetical protein [Pseudomonas schmalbachii]
MSTILPALMLASLVPVSPSLDLQPGNAGMLVLNLCFTGGGQQVRFDLRMESLGKAGRSRSRQQGQLVAATEQHCPARMQVGPGNAEEVRAYLRWWVDGVEQEPLDKRLHRL